MKCVFFLNNNYNYYYYNIAEPLYKQYKSYFITIQSIYNGCTDPLMICWFWLCYCIVFCVVLLHKMVCSYHNNINMHYTLYTIFIHSFLFFCSFDCLFVLFAYACVLQSVPLAPSNGMPQ